MNTRLLLSHIFDALVFAAEKHRHQRRKDAEETPYLNHPIQVANVLVQVASVTDPEVLQAAILHDTIEDTDATANELQTLFGADVTALVLEVSDDKSLPKQRRKELQIEKAPKLSTNAGLVKLADKICNLRDLTASPPSDWSHARQNDYLTWCEAVVARIVDPHPQLLAEFHTVAGNCKAQLSVKD